MNQTFNINRFWLLFKKTIAERPAQLLGTIALILVVTFVFFLLGVQNNQWNGAHFQSFNWGYMGGGVILSSMIFSYFNTNTGGTSYLMLPASAFEKWLCGVLLIGVLYTFIFLVFYRVMDYAFVTIYHNGLDKTSPLYQQQYDKAYIFDFDGRMPKIVYTYFVNLAGVAMLGSLYFNKAGFVKTALVTSAFLFAVYFLNSTIAHALIPHIDEAVPYRGIYITYHDSGKNLNLSKTASSIVDIIMRFILPAILWVTCYIRLKEKEI